MSTEGRSPRLVACPTCRRPSPLTAENRWRPFCSERCRSIDLGAWASESYRVDAANPPDDDEPQSSPDDPGTH